MATRSLKLTRPALLRASELEAVEEGALQILEEIGIEITNPALLERAGRAGFGCADGRVRLPRDVVRRFLEEARAEKSRSRRPRVPRESSPDRLRLWTSHYPQSVHDPESNAIVPMTTPRLAEATRVVAAFASQGVQPGVPGSPVDVPAPLETLMHFRIGLENISDFHGSVDPKVIESMPYIMEMEDILGRPSKDWPIYVFTPLRLTGESLDAALMFEDRFERVSVNSMPAAGATTPIRPLEALAVAAAEVVGSALILRPCIKSAVSWTIGLWPFDPRGMAMSFGAPEHTLFAMAGTEVDAFLHGDQWSAARGSTQIAYTLAKMPGPQAAAERASGMVTGALLGARHFDAVGTLSLDEVFSSIQLAIDIEIKNHVQRLVNGLDTRIELENLAERVAAGLSRGFMSSEETLNEYRDLYWLPDLFERRFLASWQGAGEPDILEMARAVVEKAVSGYTYQPPDDVLREIAKVYARAERELA